MRDFLYRLLSAIILVILVIGVIWFILPDTVFSYPIEKLWSFCATIFHWQEYYRKGLQTEGAIAIFFGGYLLLLILLIIYGFCHFVLWDRISPTSHFTNAFALLSSCYLLDFFVSTADPYPFGELLWVFMVFSSFFLTMLYIGEEWALLLKILVIAIGEQCLYAIIYYFLSFNQFHTPDFGNRTSGTFVNPGSLYPLCLIGFPISLILAEMEKSLHWLTKGEAAMFVKRSPFEITAVTSLPLLLFLKKTVKDLLDGLAQLGAPISYLFLPVRRKFQFRVRLHNSHNTLSITKNG